MVRASNRSLEAAKPQISIPARQQEKPHQDEKKAPSPERRIDRRPKKSDAETKADHWSNTVSVVPAERNQLEYHSWNKRCALELKKHDGLSSGARFFSAAFSLLFAGKAREDLDRVIDATIDAETSAERLSFLLNREPLGRRGAVRTRKYVVDYFAAGEKRNREKRFHDAVLFLFEEGFTREELHNLAAQAEEI
jgi:hypothetical protein